MFETLEVSSFIGRGAIAPAHEHGPLPLEGQGAHNSRINFAGFELIFNNTLAQEQ